MGEGDPLTPYQQHIPPIRRSLEEAPTGDVTVCLLPGRAQHSFSQVVLEVIEGWLVNHVSASGPVVLDRANGGLPEACLEAPAALE
jgi:hypothetical protein